MTNNIRFKDGFPLNADGSEKTAEELQEFIRKLPPLDSPIKLEDIAVFHDEPLELWAKNNGYISLDEFAKKRNVNLDDLVP